MKALRPPGSRKPSCHALVLAIYPHEKIPTPATWNHYQHVALGVRVGSRRRGSGPAWCAFHSIYSSPADYSSVPTACDVSDSVYAPGNHRQRRFAGVPFSSPSHRTRLSASKTARKSPAPLPQIHFQPARQPRPRETSPPSAGPSTKSGSAPKSLIDLGSGQSAGPSPITRKSRRPSRLRAIRIATRSPLPAIETRKPSPSRFCESKRLRHSSRNCRSLFLQHRRGTFLRWAWWFF